VGRTLNRLKNQTTFAGHDILGLGGFCSKIRPTCYTPMLPTTGCYALGWILLCSINKLLIHLQHTLLTNFKFPEYITVTLAVIDAVC